MARPEANIRLASDYTGWLAAARLVINQNQNIASFVFSADNSVVTFDTVSYNTVRLLPEAHYKPE